MTLSNRMPDSGLKFRDKLSGAIKSFLPRSDGRCAYDSGWDSAYDAFSFDPMDRERLTAGKRQHDDIQKPSLLGQSEKVCNRRLSSYICSKQTFRRCSPIATRLVHIRADICRQICAVRIPRGTTANTSAGFM